MSSYPSNPFIDSYLPQLFWPAELATFGLQVVYWPDGGDSTKAVNIWVLWVDGASDEDISPGRYSHIKVKNADLPVPPERGDMVQKTVAAIGPPSTSLKQFQVVRVEALAIGFSVLVLQEAGAVP